MINDELSRPNADYPGTSPAHTATFRESAQNSASSYREILSALPETVIQMVDGRVVDVNRPDTRVFDRRPMPGDVLSDLFSGEALELISGLVESAAEGQTLEAELDLDADRFRIITTQLRSSPTLLVVFHEVTAQRRAEQALIDLVRDKSNFLATVGHQLRTPLTAVIGYADVLAHRHPNLDETEHVDMVRDMTDQAWDLAGIIEDLLTVARSEIGDLSVASVPVNLVANTSQVLESIGDRSARILMTGDRSTTGLGDPAKFRQIVRNLISNALSHGAEPISVHASIDDQRAILRVLDRGPGVPDEIRDNMFSRYVTTDDADLPGRLGIGLWISRELASLMNGGVSYTRAAGMTTFEVWLPRLVADEAPANRSHESQDLSSKNSSLA